MQLLQNYLPVLIFPIGVKAGDMERSDNQHTINMGGRIDAALETIDKALDEYTESERLRKATDHIMAMEGITLDQNS